MVMHRLIRDDAPAAAAAVVRRPELVRAGD
jgi:hypothetical protein